MNIEHKYHSLYNEMKELIDLYRNDLEKWSMIKDNYKAIIEHMVASQQETTDIYKIIKAHYEDINELQSAE